MKLILLFSLIILALPLSVRLAAKDLGPDIENITTNEGKPVENNHHVQVTHKKHHHHKRKELK